MRAFGYTIPLSIGGDKATPGAGRQPTVHRNSFGRVTVSARKSEWAIAGFAALSFVGTLSLSYYCLIGLEHSPSSFPAEQMPVYEAKAVPSKLKDQPTIEVTQRHLLTDESTKRRQRRRHHEEPENSPSSDPLSTPFQLTADSDGTPPFSNLEHETFSRSADFRTAITAAGGSAARQNKPLPDSLRLMRSPIQ